MKVDSMRNIDFYAGVVLCFAASIFQRILLKRPHFGTCKKVLFIELSEMGSAILVDPAMKRMKNNGGVELYFVIFKGNRPSLDLLKTVPSDNIYEIQDQNFFSLAIDSFRFLFWCREKKIDTSIDLELFSRFTMLLSAFSGAKNRVGFYRFHNEGLYRGNLLTHKVGYNPHIHISKNFIALVQAALAKKETLPFTKELIPSEEVKLDKLSFTKAEKTGFKKKLEQRVEGFKADASEIILINANASDMLPQRRWMPHYFAELIQKILDSKPNAIVLLTGAPSETKHIQRIAEKVDSKRCHNFCGGVSFHELPLLYSVSTLMVTNDSGPAHIASVTELATFVIFGPETPSLYGALGNFTPIYAGLSCSPCVSAANHRKTACTDNVCLQVISPDQVFETILPTLKSHNPPNARAEA